MPDYIDCIEREAFIRFVKNHLPINFTERDVIEMIKLFPTTKAQKVRYGKWNYIAIDDCFSCNLCKYDSDVATNYCGGCGAIMDNT